MSDLLEQYRELLVDHSKNPRYSKKLTGDNIQFTKLKNPLCNDEIEIYLSIQERKIKDIGAIANGCAISTACASLMAERINGETVSQVKKIYSAVHQMLIEQIEPDDSIDLKEVYVISAVKNFPLRIKCALLPWRALLLALENSCD